MCAGWTDEWVFVGGEGTDEEMEGQIDVQMESWMDGCRLTDKRWMDEWIDRRRDGYMGYRL